MTSNENELDINEIAGEHIMHCLINFVKKRLKSDDVELSIEYGSKKGDNFMGEIYRILYKEANSIAKENQSSLILKIGARARLERSQDLFVREINMYEEVLSYFNEFQLSKGVDPDKDGFNECPKCYFSIREEMSESLFLEDLKRRDFEMINHRQEPITFDHISLFMKAIGKFHAISFALKDQQPEKFKQLTSLTREQYWTMVKTEFGDNFLDRFIQRFENVLEEENRFDLLKKFKKATGENYIEFILNLVSRPSNNSCAVISHGDATINNSMFSKDEEGKPIAVQIFDWQFSRYASPIFDLVIYLFCSATKKLRDQHYDEFLKIYHDSLSNLLRRLGSDPEKLFPFEALLNQLKHYGIYSAFVGAFFIPILYAEKDSMPSVGDVNDDLSMDDIFLISAESKPAYHKQVLDLFIDLDRLDYM